MSRNRVAVLGVALGLLLLLVLGTTGPAESVPVSRAEVPTVRAPGRAESDAERCRAEEAETRAALDALPPLEDLRAEVSWARGQAALLAGSHVPPVFSERETQAAFEKAMADGLPEGTALRWIDCEEYPCLMSIKGPLEPATLKAIGGGLKIAIWHTYSNHLVAFVDPVRGLDREELKRRLLYRNDRITAREGTPPPLAQPEPTPPEPVGPSGCGEAVDSLRRAHSEARAEIDTLQRRRDHYDAELRYIAGDPIPFPDDLDPRFSPEVVEPLALDLADQTLLTLVVVDCSEYPCLLGFRGPGEPPTPAVMGRGYHPSEFNSSLQTGGADPDLYWIALKQKDDPWDFKRLISRQKGYPDRATMEPIQRLP